MNPVPYNTGKVQIGVCYTPKPPKMDEFDEQIQEALLGVRSFKYTMLHDIWIAFLYCFGGIAFIAFWTWVRSR